MAALAASLLLLAVLLDGLALEVDGAYNPLAGLTQKRYSPVQYATHDLAEQYRVRSDVLDLDNAVVAAAAASR